MRNEAQANADTDRKAREMAEKINTADSLIFQTEKQLKEYGDKIPDHKKEAIETALASLKEAHKAQDIARIDSAVEALNNAWQAASQEMYQATQQQDGAQAGNTDFSGNADGNTTGKSNTDDVTDVEYEEVKQE